MSFTRFNNKIGAGVLVGLGVLYAAIALASGHSAVAEPPPDLSADEAGLSVWKALRLRAEAPGKVAVVDVRPAERFTLYHLPGSLSAPGADAAELLAAARGKAKVLLVAQKDADAAKLVGQAKKVAGEKRGKNLHFLKGGARAWYLALELPTPLFEDKAPPHGYETAMARVQTWLNDGADRPADKSVIKAIGTLARLGFQPSALQGKKKPKSSGKKKKIAGGCG